MPIHVPDLSLERAVAPRTPAPSAWAGMRKSVLVVLLFFLVTVGLQVASGAFHSEFGSYPDEPAHYVTSLMVREYITSPHPVWPMPFAENYYYHYPKVAFGHWPPLFYVVQAFWMMLFSVSRASIRLEMAVTTTLWAFAIFREANRWFGWWAGVFAGLVTVCLPLVQASTDEEMAETLLALTCFLSTVYFARYLESERRRDALWFAFFFSLAVLTKGSGWLLVFVPPIALLLTRKVRLAFRGSFWFALGVIAACCLPWQVMTLRVAARGWAGGTTPSVHYTASSFIEFGSVLLSMVGPILAAITAIGIAATVVLPIVKGKNCGAAPAAMLALILGDWIFHSLVPAGVEDRKMIMAVPGLVLFLVAGARWLADCLPAKMPVLPYRLEIVLAAVAFIFALRTFSVPHQRHFGYSEAAQFITSNPALRGATILVSSANLGEGLLISEIAMREPRPQDTIVRGTKALADVDWTGLRYRPVFTTEEQMFNYLQQSRIGVVVTDNFPAISNFEHSRLLAKTIEDNPSRFHLLRVFPSSSFSGIVQVFERR